MTNATFYNFSAEAFTGYWNGKSKTFKAGEKVYMPAYLAEHFAKHLTNRELIRTGKETYTSPKDPAKTPQFMEVFNKAFIRDTASENQNEIDAEISAVQGRAPSMNIDLKQPGSLDKGPAAAQEALANEVPAEELNVGPGSAPQVINGPAGDDDDESAFDTGNSDAKA